MTQCTVQGRLYFGSSTSGFTEDSIPDAPLENAVKGLSDRAKIPPWPSTYSDGHEHSKRPPKISQLFGPISEQGAKFQEASFVSYRLTHNHCV